MSTTQVILRVIHVAAAAVWFAAPLGAASMVKRGMAAGGDGFKTAASEAVRRGNIGVGAGVVTLLSGFTLIFSLGGFKWIGPPIHAALSLVIVMLLIEAFLAKPAGAGLLRLSQEAGGEKDPAAAGLLKRYAMAGGIVQLLWVAVLALMFINPM